MIGGMQQGTVEMGNVRYAYMLYIAPYAEEKFREVGFENVNRAALIFSEVEYNKGPSISLKGGKLEISTNSCALAEKLRPQSIYFIDLKACKITPLEGTWSYKDFDNEEERENTMLRILSHNRGAVSQDE